MRSEERLDFRILGPLEVWAGDEALPLPQAKQRATLTVLLLHANEPVSADRLIDALWGERPPATAKTALQGYITQLRRLLEPGRKKREAADVLVTTPAGYALRVDEGALDRDRFESRATEGRAHLVDDRADRALRLLQSALEVWRGPALAEFMYEPWARADAERLEELRLECLEDRIEAGLRLGRHAELVGELEALVSEHPLREGLRAQLMLALYRTGRQADALEVYQQARRVLVDELGLDPGPRLRELEAAILRQEDALDAPTRARPATNLPTPPTPLVGRERELEDAGELLLRDDVRLLTLVGAGGTGKTRLALALAAQKLPHFSDGVFLSELAPVTDSDLALSSIAETLELKEAGPLRPLDQLKQAVADRRLLLVLDNLEQIPDVGECVAELLASCSQLKVLATSRTPLHVRAEHEFPVGPLRQEEGIELFRQRAEAVRPDFHANGEVPEICARLDCLPLAIELAAPHVKLLSAPALLERLVRQHGISLLTAGARDLPERQRTLRATIEWSHELLDPDEQRLFARLAVFAGGWTLEAAEDICAVDFDLLGSLVDKSLVVLREERYSMLETIREYAAEQLEQSGEAERLRQAHAEHFLSVATTADENLAGPEQGHWLRALSLEQPNLRAALGWAIERDNGALALSLCARTGWFWYIRRLREGRRWLDAALAIAPGPPDVRATALMRAGNLADSEGDYSAAEAYYREAYDLTRSSGDDARAAGALSNLGSLALNRGEYPTARRLFEESLTLAPEGGVGVASALANLGQLALAEGDVAQAIEFLERSLTLAQTLGHRYGEAVVRHTLGAAMVDAGAHERACVLLRESLHLWQELEAPAGAAGCLEELANVAAACGEGRLAARDLGAADSIKTTTGQSARVSAMDQERRARTEATARAQVGEVAFAEAYDEGRSMTPETATAYAIEEANIVRRAT